MAQYATDVDMKILGAIASWAIGRQLVNLTVCMVGGLLSRQKVDPTVLRYVSSIVIIMLNVLLMTGILGCFGVRATTFTALITTADVAIDMTWSGLLSNLATGVFLIAPRPLKAGDFVTASDVTGTIKEISLFAMTVNALNNVVSIVGNGRIFVDTIQSYISNSLRRVELRTQLTGSTGHHTAIALLKEKVAAIPGVLTESAVDVEILEFNLVRPVLVVRPYTHSDNYWQVYFDTNRTIKEALVEGGFPAPTPSQTLTITTLGQLTGLAATVQSTATPAGVS